MLIDVFSKLGSAQIVHFYRHGKGNKNDGITQSHTLTVIPVACFKDDVAAAAVDEHVTGQRCGLLHLQSTFAVPSWKERIA